MDERPDPSMKKEPQDRSMPELLRGLARIVPDYVRAEIAWLKAEARDKGMLVGQGVGLFLVALMFLSMAIATATALAVIVFDLFLPLWLAALLVTLLWLLIAVGLALVGVQRFKKLSPEEGKKAPPVKKQETPKPAKKPDAPPRKSGTAGQEGKTGRTGTEDKIGKEAPARDRSTAPAERTADAKGTESGSSESPAETGEASSGETGESSGTGEEEMA